MLKFQVISKRTASIYSLILARGPLTAREIGEALKIFSNAVYRSTKTLEYFGCVTRSGKHPTKFVATPPGEAIETYSLLLRESFLRVFAEPHIQKHDRGMINVEFIQSRQTMFDKSAEDLRNTKKEAHLIVSGDEAPAEVMLEDKRAIERGVSIKMLVQKRNQSNEALLQNWKRIGIEVRLTPPLNARILIHDERIVYFMSYDSKNIRASIGIRFEYEPLGRLINTIFLERWRTAERL